MFLTASVVSLMLSIQTIWQLAAETRLISLGHILCSFLFQLCSHVIYGNSDQRFCPVALLVYGADGLFLLRFQIVEMTESEMVLAAS